MLPESATNLIIAIFRQYSFSMYRSRLSKAANLLLQIALSRFCHREFVCDTGSFYFTLKFILYTF